MILISRWGLVTLVSRRIFDKYIFRCPITFVFKQVTLEADAPPALHQGNVPKIWERAPQEGGILAKGFL